MVREIKPGSIAAQAAETEPCLVAGAHLGYLNGLWVVDLDYFDVINEIRTKRPLTLGFIAPPSTVAPEPKPAHAVPIKLAPPPLAPLPPALVASELKLEPTLSNDEAVADSPSHDGITVRPLGNNHRES
eukprot:SAG11_NODE_411_length_9696_cov_46.841513_2_plen_129_part_00